MYNEPTSEGLISKEICNEQIVTKLRHWVDNQVQEIDEEAEARITDQKQIIGWLETSKIGKITSEDMEIFQAAESQIKDIDETLKLLEKKKLVFRKEKETHEVEELMVGKTKKEIVEEITERLNRVMKMEENRGEMNEVAEDKSGMVWGKQTYCHELSPWSDLYETLLFYVDREHDEEND